LVCFVWLLFSSDTDCLNADLYDLEFDKDPTFWRTSLSFDIKSAETMLLNKLPVILFLKTKLISWILM